MAMRPDHCTCGVTLIGIHTTTGTETILHRGWKSCETICAVRDEHEHLGERRDRTRTTRETNAQCGNGQPH
jgi:hypothetical protein